jgi:hypothetical protein
MDQNTNNTPMPEEKSSMTSIASIILIVIVIAVGALYFFKQVPAPVDNAALTPAETQSDATVSSLSTQSTSTDINDIEKDLNATNLSGVNAGMNNISI